MAKHTPGPWEVHSSFPFQRVVAGKSLIVARMGGDSVEADVHLIAAAPDLLGALKDARFRLAEMQYQIVRGTQPNDTPEVERLVARLDSVIAKAEDS